MHAQKRSVWNGGTKWWNTIVTKNTGRRRTFNGYINNTHDKIYELGGTNRLSRPFKL